MADSRGRGRVAGRRGSWLALLAAAGTFAAVTGAFGTAAADPGHGRPASEAGHPIVRPPNRQSFAPLVKQVMPSVVSLSVVMRAAEDGDEAGADLASPSTDPSLRTLRRRLLDGPVPPGRRMALGSGFIIDPAGFLVTNNHVLGESDTITVTLNDDSQYPARVVGRDPSTDLAVLKIDPARPLPAVSWGDSDQLEIGDWVLAVGNPFGLGNSVTTGIVSARGRDIHAGPFDSFLQIDAPVNRGNSGGPTFDLDGRVVGINTAIYSPNGGSVGIAFAIPANLALPVIDQLLHRGSVSRGWLGVQAQELSADLARALGLDPDHPAGALIADVTADGPAARAGVRQGDVILKLGDAPVGHLRDLRRLAAAARPGQGLDVVVWRQGSERILRAVVGDLAERVRAAAEAPALRDPAPPSTVGLMLGELTEARRRQLGLDVPSQGVLVIGVVAGSAAADQGIEPGDLIVGIDQRPVASREVALRLLDAAKARSVLLLVWHQGSHHFVALTGARIGRQG